MGLAEAGDVDGVDGAFADGGEVELVEELEGAGGDAAAAGFVAGQGLFFEEEGGAAGGAEAAGGGCAGGSGADHDGVPDGHAVSVVRTLYTRCT